MNADLQAHYEELLAHDPFLDQCLLTIEHIGDLIDLSGVLGKVDGARRAITLCDQVRKHATLSDEESATLYYFEANAWSVMRLSRGPLPVDQWHWKDESFENEIRRLRQARRSPGFPRLDSQRQAQIYTNLGNALDTLGRFVEALECYDRAVKICPEHGMARGNLGICLTHYGQMQPHLPHRQGYCSTAAFLKQAWMELEASLALPLEQGAAEHFTRYRDYLEQRMNGADSAEGFVASGTAPGETAEERQYRSWCLSMRLFLNPLNDLGVFPEAATDVLYLPNIVTGLSKDFYVYSLFNQLKQEYTTARYLLYEGVAQNPTHFADRDVALVNTLDYASYSMSLEKTRLTFRIAYSQFDKIAFLLNAYFCLEISPQKVSFRTLWYQKEDCKRELKATFQNKENWPLRGLFGLSRDLGVKNDDRDCLDPDAHDLVLIRNHLEHKHLTIHEESWIASGRGSAGEAQNGLSFAVDRSDFESRALRALKLGSVGKPASRA